MSVNAQPMWESYGLFALDGDGKPRTWLEFNGDQAPLLAKLGAGEGVFGVEIRIPSPRTGTVMP